MFHLLTFIKCFTRKIYKQQKLHIYLIPISYMSNVEFKSFN
jgi:hypothetical protein